MYYLGTNIICIKLRLKWDEYTRMIICLFFIFRISNNRVSHNITPDFSSFMIVSIKPWNCVLITASSCFNHLLWKNNYVRFHCYQYISHIILYQNIKKLYFKFRKIIMILFMYARELNILLFMKYQGTTIVSFPRF